jgi:GxxExxY protein
MGTDATTDQILGAAMRVHSALGPGLLESVYRTCLHHELTKRGLTAVQEKSIPIQYDGIVLSAGFRIDLLVEETVLAEVKAVERMRLCTSLSF